MRAVPITAATAATPMPTMSKLAVRYQATLHVVAINEWL
jgi:hypothetical protein